MEEQWVDYFENQVLYIATSVILDSFFLSSQHPTAERYEPVQPVSEYQVLPVDCDCPENMQDLQA
jgi:hypothetical protein